MVARVIDVPREAALEIRPAMSDALEPWLARRGLTGRPLILIQAGNKRTMRRGARQRVTNTKYWPEENWAGVIRGLRAERPDHAILLLGVPAEYELNDEVAKLAGVADVHNVADDLPIQILLPLMQAGEQHGLGRYGACACVSGARVPDGGAVREVRSPALSPWWSDDAGGHAHRQSGWRAAACSGSPLMTC